MKNLWSNLKETADFLTSLMKSAPRVGLILGTGLGNLVESIEQDGSVDFSEIPHFPVSTALGHAGRLIWGKWSGCRIMALQGRFHYYEGYSLQQVAFPVRVMKLAGCGTLIATNAAGSLNPSLPSGSVMVITDHINLLGGNPLTGSNLEEMGPRFPDLGRVYSPELVELALEIARRNAVDLHPGVLVAVSGPNFETAAEYRSFQFMGADAVGMSVIPESITAAHCDMRVLAFSGISDECFHPVLEPLTGEQVVAVAEKIAPALTTLISKVLERLPD